MLEPLRRGNVAAGPTDYGGFVSRDSDGCPFGDYQCQRQASELRQTEVKLQEMQERQQYYDALQQQRSLKQYQHDIIYNPSRLMPR